MKVKKTLRKFQPNSQYYVKKIEAQSKEWFSYKKACTSIAGKLKYP